MKGTYPRLGVQQTTKGLSACGEAKKHPSENRKMRIEKIIGDGKRREKVERGRGKSGREGFKGMDTEDWRGERGGWKGEFVSTLRGGGGGGKKRN